MASRGAGNRDDAFAVVNQAMADFEGGGSAAGSPFISSASFAGRKAGYYFAKGSKGVGYVSKYVLQKLIYLKYISDINFKF